MTAVRLLVWLGVLGWGLILFNFLVAFFFRRDPVRLTFVFSALGGMAFLLSGLVSLPQLLRAALGVGLSIGGACVGVALTLSLLQHGWRVLR